MQLCRVCLEEKPLSDFYAMKNMKSGHMSKCKECFKKEMHAARERNIEHYREYDRNRGSRMTNDDLRKQRALHPHWTRAHNAVNKAVRSGKLIKKPCEVCGAFFVHAHHPDYSKPLEVVWLCPLHHRQVHAQIAA